MPEDFLAHISIHYRDYLSTPTQYREMDASTTSWNFFKQVIDERRKQTK
jgi:hypothetical protein